MTTFRLMVLLSTLLLTALLIPAPGPALADSILPDGCLGNLNDNQVVVYYFHRKFRCQSCEVLESTLMSTIQVTYSNHFGAGRLAMCIINVDDPENRFYLEQFEILGNSIVIVEKRGGVVSRYKNLESIWDVSEDRDAITQLLENEVGGFLSES
ncbi:hypothetical protein KAJ77_03380 [bacterium]|nr:hypothetical protein [bacterium]